MRLASPVVASVWSSDSEDFLRVMCVLEGFRRRLDLESAIDWMGKGRVLVYERPGSLE